MSVTMRQLGGTYLIVSLPPTEGVTLLLHWSLKSQHYSLQATYERGGVPFVV